MNEERNVTSKADVGLWHFPSCLPIFSLHFSFQKHIFVMLNRTGFKRAERNKFSFSFGKWQNMGRTMNVEIILKKWFHLSLTIQMFRSWFKRTKQRLVFEFSFFFSLSIHALDDIKRLGSKVFCLLRPLYSTTFYFLLFLFWTWHSNVMESKMLN